MSIAVKQINQAELTLFVQQSASGAALSGSLLPYLTASGWLGPNVLYLTGGSQSITGEKTFLQSPIAPSGGSALTVANKQYVLAQLAHQINSLSGYSDATFVSLIDNEVVLGRKVFTGALGVGSGSTFIDAINLGQLLSSSGVLQSQIDNVTVANTVNTTGDQTIAGTKTFSSSPLVPIPVNGSGAVPKSYVDSLQLTGVIYTTGAQTVSGVKTFLNSPVIPVAVASNAPVTLAQLNATAFNYSPTSGYSVTSLNGVTGGILTQGANGITTYMCGSVLYVSGNAATSSLLYSAQIPIPSGATGLSFAWGTGFSSKPTVTPALEVTGNAPIFFVSTNLYGVTTGGFNVAFQSGIPHNNYVLNFNAIPAVSGSGFYGVRGEQGQAQPTWNARGVWRLGLSYSRYDYVYQPSIGTSYVATSGHNSDSFNFPTGTGNLYWTVVSSGQQGAQGPIGYYINSGIVTGNVVNMSFYLNPPSSGLDLAESFVASSFNITGFKLGCVDTGVAPLLGGILSGRFYARDDNGNKTILRDFTFNTGVRTFFSGGLTIPFTGLNRLGIDITNTLSGISKFSIGVFGFGI